MKNRSTKTNEDALFIIYVCSRDTPIRDLSLSIFMLTVLYFFPQTFPQRPFCVSCLYRFHPRTSQPGSPRDECLVSVSVTRKQRMTPDRSTKREFIFIDFVLTILYTNVMEPEASLELAEIEKYTRLLNTLHVNKQHKGSSSKFSAC